MNTVKQIDDFEASFLLLEIRSAKVKENNRQIIAENQKAIDSIKQVLNSFK